MKTHKITTSKVEFVLADYPDWSSLIIDCNFYKLKLGVNIFRVNSITEEDAKLIVDEDNEYGVTMYRHYGTTSMAYYDEQLTALESLHSLLKSKGIDINSGNWYLFKKI